MKDFVLMSTIQTANAFALVIVTTLGSMCVLSLRDPSIKQVFTHFKLIKNYNTQSVIEQFDAG